MEINSGFNHKIVNESEIDKSKGIIYNIENKINLPDLDQLLTEIINILEYMNNDELLKKKKENYNEFESEMEKKFPYFSFRYYGIFKKILSGEDISTLLQMLTEIHKVQIGEKSIEEAERNLGEQLASKYIYPKMKMKKKEKKRKKLKDKS